MTVPSDPSTAAKPNHLIREKSPYLLQHAYNPVDWYPWGEEAFAKALREDRLILVSIGYSTCHWCHVMEEESFSNPDIAAIMNKYLVSIKVDREERPDVDKIYMTAVMALTGQGGWPLNAFLTPDLKPFFGGTYFPPDSRWGPPMNNFPMTWAGPVRGGRGRPGWPQIVEHLGKSWRNPEERKKILASSEQLTSALQNYLSGGQAPSPQSSPTEGRGIFWTFLSPGGRGEGEGDVLLRHAAQAFKADFDTVFGGWGKAPKFPMSVNHNFLFRYYARAIKVKDEEATAKDALTMSLTTLRAMSRGGIYDHLGGGFHRYSTDERWHIPHFEKMLYDNAQLAVNYIEAYQITHEEEFARIARETLDYILREMTDPQGGFYSAEDADSLPSADSRQKREGAFYVWGKGEILRILGEREEEFFSYHYGVEAGGNARTDPLGEFQGKNILYAAHSAAETAKKFGMTEGEMARLLEEGRKKLLTARLQRPRPHRDDKVLTSWNGLAISAFARGASVLKEPRYLEAAKKAATFIRENLYEGSGHQLFRRWREGSREIPGMADDYAFLVQGLLDLYEASFDPQWLDWAIELTEIQNKKFYDAPNGGFFMTASDHDKHLLARVKEDSDNVEPSPSSVASLNLLRLWRFINQEDFRQAAEKTLRHFGGAMKENPRSLPQMLIALDFALSPPQHIVIAGDPDAEDTRKMLGTVHVHFQPRKVLLLVDGGERQKHLAQRLPFLKGMIRLGDKATAYVCVDYACKLPTNDAQVLAQQLNE